MMQLNGIEDGEVTGRWQKLGGLLVITSLALLLVCVGALAYFFTLPPPEPSCDWYWNYHAVIVPDQVPEGYRFVVTSTSDRAPFECYKVRMLRNGSAWPDWSGLPTTVSEGVLTSWQMEESLSFSDSDGDGRLSSGDYFEMRDLRPDTIYELVLVNPKNDNIVAWATVHTP